MADTILNPDGKIVGVYPTMYQEDHDRMKGETEAHNRKADKARAEIERKAARARKATPDESERRAAIVEGLRRFAKKAARAGDDDLSKKLNTYVESTEKALAEYERIGKKLRGKRPDPLGDAQKVAAAELMKVLPACFPTEKDAMLFARRLPLGDALAEAGRQVDAFVKLGEMQVQAGRRFWAEVEAVARLAAGGTDIDSSVRALAAAGMM